MAVDAFNLHAAGYDEVAQSALGIELRSRVQSVLTDVTAPGDAVVDLGCGSGLDAMWLAPQVRSVQAFDASAEMVAITRGRCANLANVTVTQADVAELDVGEPVDVVLANFGVINCVGELGEFASRLRAMLVPGGIAVLVTMARWCPLELAIAAATGNIALFRRRAGRTTNYHGLEVRYASAGDLGKTFGSHLTLTSSRSLGLALPPFEQRGWIEHRPRLGASLAKIDQRLAGFGGRVGWGDHHIATFRRNS